MGVCEAQRLLRVEMSPPPLSSSPSSSPPPPRWSPLLVTQITCRPGAIRRARRRRLSSPLLATGRRWCLSNLSSAGIGSGLERRRCTAAREKPSSCPPCPPCLYRAILSTLAHRRARAIPPAAPPPRLCPSPAVRPWAWQAGPLAAVSSPRRPWSGVVCSDRRPHGLRRGACMSPNGPEPPRQPRSHVGQTQAPVARWDGSAPMEPSANGSERAREAETAECAGGGPLLLSRGLRGPERQTQKYRDDGGAQRRNGRF